MELQHRLSADRKSRRVARSGLVQCESAKRRAAAGEKSLRQRNQPNRSRLCRKRQRLRIAIRRQNPDPEGPSEAVFSPDRVISRVLKEKSQEARARTDVRVGNSQIRAVE